MTSNNLSTMATFNENISSKQTPGKRPTLEEQLAKFQDDLLNHQCADIHLGKLTNTFSEWQSIGIGLELIMVEIKDIETAWPRDPQNQRIEMFRKWKVRFGKQATYRYEIKGMMHALYTLIRLFIFYPRSLIKVFYEANRIDVIESLQKIVAENPLSIFDTPPTNSSHKLIRYGSYLKDQYLENIITYSFDGSLERADKIFNLAMIKEPLMRRGKIEDRYVRMTITGKVDDILHMKSPIELKDILKSDDEKRKVVLLEGAPGSGKTTLTVHICQKWGKDELFQEYTLVIMVQLRNPELQNAQSIADLLPSRDTAMAEEMAAEITAKDGEGVLWILDGWDELPTKLQQQSIFRHLISPPTKSPTRKSAIIVTSRPISSANLYRCVSCRIEVLGFTETELKKYFSECLSEEPPSVVEALINQVNENPILASSCYLPLNAAFIAHFYLCNDHSLPRTQYELFLNMILHLIFRQIKKEGDHEDLEALESLKEIPAELEGHFQAICKLAYNGLMENKVAFTSKDLPKEINTLGLLQAVESFGIVGKCKSYHFLHLTFQEFLTAHYMATSLTTEEQILQFTQMYDKPRFSVVIQFFGAITKLAMKGFPEMISHLRLCTSWNQGIVAFFHCVYEAQDPDLCIFVAEKLLQKKLHLFFITLTPNDCLCIGYFIACVCSSSSDSEPLEVDLSSAYIGDRGCKFLLKDLASISIQDVTMCTSLQLSIPGSQLSEVGLQSLADFLHSSSSQILKKLTLGCKEPSVAIYTDSDTSELDLVLPLSKALEINRTLTKLSMVKCNLKINEANGQALATMLKTNRSLQVLNLARNPEVGDQGAMYLAEGLKLNYTLKKLNISDCGISSEGVNNIAHALTINKILQNLNVEGNEIMDAGVVCFAKALKANVSLTNLNLADCGMTDVSLSVLGICLAENRSIKTLRIGQEQVQTRRKKSLSSYFNSRTEKITAQCISEKGLMQLAAQLNDSSSSLETLEISDTLLTDSQQANKVMKKLKKKVHVKLYYSNAFQTTRYPHSLYPSPASQYHHRALARASSQMVSMQMSMPVLQSIVYESTRHKYSQLSINRHSQ